VRGGPDPALLSNWAASTRTDARADGARVDGGAKGSPVTAGQPVQRFDTLLRPGQHPAKPLRAAAAARGATRIRGRGTSRPPTGGLLKSFGTVAVLLPCRFCWRWQHLKRAMARRERAAPSLIMATAAADPA